jgi:predicted dehydrogenase
LKESGAFGRLLAARFFNYTDKYAGSAGEPMPDHVRPSESRPVRFPNWPLAPDWLAKSLVSAYARYVNVVSHNLNLLRFLIGDDILLSGAARPNDRTVLAQFASGEALVTVEAVQSSEGQWMEGAEFIFEEGRLALDIPWPMNREAVTRVIWHGRGRPRQSLPSPAGWAFEMQARAFVDALCNDEPSRSDGADCLGDLALIEDIWHVLGAHQEAV